MKKVLFIAAINMVLCATASAFQGGGGEPTVKKPVPKKKPTVSKPTTTSVRPVTAPPKPPPPLFAGITINSNQAYTAVAINGNAVGTTDANGYLAIGSLRPGTYTVSVAKPGYNPGQSVVNLAAGQTESLYVELRPITQAVNILSAPTECEVYVDDVLRGRTDVSGSLRLTDLPLGEHRVTLRKNRYKDSVVPLSLNSDKEGQIYATLELAVGTLSVTTNVPNPSIDITGLGHFDQSVSKFECQPGTYFVTISSPLYVTQSRRAIAVSAGKEAELSVDLQPDTEARDRLAAEALEAYNNQQYDRAIDVAETLVAAEPKHAQALSVIAESFFVKDDFISFLNFGNRAIEAGGSVEVSLKHHHEFFVASNFHSIRLAIDAQSVTYDPQPEQLPAGSICPNSPFKVSLAILGGAEVSGNRQNEVYLRLTFVDPQKPKKSNSLRFGDRESYFVQVRKNAAGGLVSYVGETMVSREQALGAMSAIAGLVNRTKVRWNANVESSNAANRPPEVILETGDSNPEAGTTSALPSLESIITANIKARGTPVKWTTAMLRGSVNFTTGGNTISGAYEESFKGGNKFYQMFSREPGQSFLEQGYDGNVAWYRASKEKASRMNANDVASAKRDLKMYFLTDVKEFQAIYPDAKIKGQGKFGDLEVFVIETTPTVGRLETLYFSTATGLLVRQDAKYEDPNKKGTMINTSLMYDEYIDVGGIKMPSAWRQITPSFTMSVKITDTRIDVPIDDAKFKMPNR